MAIFRGFAIYFAFAGIILALILISRLNMSDPKPAPVLMPAVNPYQHTIAASGIIESADKNIEIGVPQSGLVKMVFVRVWDAVQENAPLFQMDDRDLEAQLIVQKANVAVSLANLGRLKDQLSRLEGVKDLRAISQEELKTKRHDVAVAEAQLAAAEAAVHQTQLLIERLTIRAPKEGIILQSNIRKGESVLATNPIPAMILGDLEHLQVRADIDEQNACKILPYAPATAFPKNNTTLAIPLQFDRIEPYVIPKRSLTGASEERVDTRVLQVIYTFAHQPSFPLYVGQQVDVFIKQGTKQIDSHSSEVADAP
ncbi:efflux RND transporter periplasmic adaptor subunit [Candidatus Protochlamydia phocaeensis]|uniref:efflux RND transporter periplasmic adaptor subunit n=1 Tax=Candidatus Protochlamydia phocaeensis TaxID=1414722 RepID=UPI0008386B1E|nr:efflux RND transporter periplasmic adaptor subunit [Candidatus Protochlamydia phocaeensis]